MCINMYKNTLIVLMLLVIVRSEEISVKDVAQANFSNLRLSTILPYLSLHNDQNLTKDNAKRSLFLLMPSSQITKRDKYKKPNNIGQKTKRCGTLPRKNKFFLLSRKEDSMKTEMNTGDLNKNIKISRETSNPRTFVKNVKYLQENLANKMKAKTLKNNMFLRASKNNINAENIILNLKSRGKVKKCNTENCVCYCKEKNCFSTSSMESSSDMLSSSKKDKKPEQINHQRLAKHKNTKSNIFQHTSPKLYHKGLQKLRVPNLNNFFPTRFYQERICDTPPASILYEKPSNILPYIGNEKKLNIGVPFTSFKDRLNFRVKNNTCNQPIIHQNLYPYSRIVEESQVGNPVSTTSSSTSYVDATTITQTESDLESIEITEKDEKHLLKLTAETPNNYVDMSIDSETETNFYPNYSNDVTEESSTTDFYNLDETMYKLEDSTEKIKGNQENDFSKLMPFFTNYVEITTPSIYPSITRNEKLVNMEECIKLFGRDVCVLSATSPEIFAKQTQENDINEYSTIRIPEYIIQMSTKEGTTLNNINYSDKFKIIDTYAQSKPSTSKIETSTVDSNEYFQSTNAELNVEANTNFPQEFYQYAESTEQTYESDDNCDKNKLFKKLMNQISDKSMETARNTLLGKSKSYTVKLLSSPNNKKTNPTSSENYLYSTNSYEYNNDKEINNLKDDEQTLITDINVNSWSTLGVLWNSLCKEEATNIINYDFKTGYNSEEKNRNYLKQSNINIYPGRKISQEEFKEEDTTVNHDSKIGYNFKEEITNKFDESRINTSREKKIFQGQSEEITTINYDSKAIYDFEEENMYDLKKLNTDFNSEKEILQEQLEREIITPMSTDSTTEYNFEETTDNDLLGTKTIDLEDEILREQPLMQYLDYEIINDLNNKEDTTNNPETIIDLPSKRLPYCDNTLLLNSIRKVINDFASNTSLTETKNLDKNILQTQGKSLLPEILQIPNLKSILSIPQIENTIVEKVKDILSDVEYEEDKNTYSEENTTRETIYKTEKDERDQILNGIQKIEKKMQGNEVKELVEPLKTTVSYDKAILQNNLISTISIEPNLIKAEELNKKEKSIVSETTTISSIMTKNVDETEKIIVNLTSRIKDINANNDNNKSINCYVLDNKNLQDTKNYHINNENVQVTTISSNFMEKISPNYAQISNGIISGNMEEVKDIGDETEYILNRKILTKPSDKNLISSTNVKYRNEESKIASSTDEIDPAIILERIEHNLSPIKYYSPEILKYIKSHHVNADTNVKVTTAFANYMQETLSNYTQMSDDIISQNGASPEDVGDERESILNDKTLTTVIDNVISFINIDYENYESKVTPSIDQNTLDSQQQNFMTKDNIIAHIKTHEATTEIQQTYAEPTYFPKISSSSSACKADANSNDNKNKNSNNNNSDNLIGNKIYNANDITTETDKVIISSSKSCFFSDPFHLFPSDISELEKSKLYYISDNMTAAFPLEVRKLKDNTYALSIKNICEQIFERKCSCCVPLQGHVILSWNKNQDEKDDKCNIMTSSQENAKNVKKDYYSTESPSIMITTKEENTLKMQKSEEGRLSVHYHWKRNLNDNNLITILMPVIDFAKKYNLLLDFNKRKMLFNETGSHDIIRQNNDKSLIKSIRKFKYDQLERKNLNENLETKKNEFMNENKDAIDKLQNSVNFRGRKDITMSTNFSTSPISQDFENSIEIESWKKNRKANQVEITEDLHKLESEKNTQNVNTERKTNSKNQKRNPLFKRINIFKKDTEIKNEEMKSDNQITDIEKGDVRVFSKKKERKSQQIIESENQEKIPISRIIISGNKVGKSEKINWDKLADIEQENAFYKKKKREHKVCTIDNKQNNSKIKISEEDNKKPYYRYQRNANGIINKKAELVKSMLFWFKSLFSDK
ncbi:uncharacterized protein [Anoplolepis gracilipes]|uniref:uncharacterized protein n=1 Tax=Anoplolepis gracilipes TaxID=354296 RepID=UPI003BA0E927